MTARPGLRHPLIALVWLGILGIGAAALGRGGQAPADHPADAPSTRSPYIYGAGHCAACHDQDKHPTYNKEDRDGMICRMNEFPQFDSQDKHKLAFAALTGSRGREMGRLLGKEVTQIDACINCHGVPDRGVRKQQYVRETDGVTCVACHGRYADWVERHTRTDDPDWHDLDPRARQQRYGMTDLRDPAIRAETCASCHIGNTADGKIVTHEMYAKGHPPLPSFEAATFSDAQPRHWESFREKTPARKKRVKAIDSGEFEQTRLVMVSGLVSLRESMKLFAEQAKADKPDPPARGGPILPGLIARHATTTSAPMREHPGGKPVAQADPPVVPWRRTGHRP